MVYWIDYAFSTLENGRSTSYIWRVPTILQCVFLIPMIFIVFIIPETPRWLAARDRNEEALEILTRLNKGKMSHEEIQSIHSDIVRTVAIERSIGAGTWGDLLKNDSIQSRRRFLIACGIQAFQQLGGINALICKLFDLQIISCFAHLFQQTTLARSSKTAWASTLTFLVSCQDS